MTESNVTLYIATSVDGYIADDDGGVGWLDEFEEDTENDDIVEAYEEFFDSVECLVMGATTYEQILGFGEWPYGDLPTYVFTHRELPQATDTVEFVAGDVDSVATELEEQYDHCWLVGGAQLAREFLRTGHVDDLRLSLIPVLLGSGIPLFTATDETRRLQHLDTQTFRSGIVELRYSVEKHHHDE
ncbi:MULTISPECIES: dihydrofolate reductase family protein [Haloferax]|uniref:Dihydrofolate reductase n=1 Tax=Haloferax marinum TaxID=2666143 RepID=A0A6A8G436_9EURY|nr:MULTISPECIES: dihydrofolate reductase family protein [Haloferax]KAB1196552.1 dihydrofolate reductase [Haloferax sp. CBA1150]MRW95555.1 dihydrofolate reductase [Haloferax marinum]